MSQELALDSRHRASLARILPFALYIGFLAAMPLIADALPGFDRRWFYAIQIGAVAVALAFFARHYVELRFVRPLSINQWLAGLATGLAVFIFWISLDLPWMKLGADGTAGFDPRDAAGAVIWPLALVRVLGAALVVPVMEELFWRSFVMRWIDNPKFLAVMPAAISLRALLLSSLVFGVEHDLWLAGIVAGLAYGWLYMRSGNLWSPILAHGLTNLLLGLWVLNTGNWQFW
ncbi:MAG: CAAX prenyl protease-related protein [Pseudomonadota bacterium]